MAKSKMIMIDGITIKYLIEIDPNTFKNYIARTTSSPYINAVKGFGKNEEEAEVNLIKNILQYNIDQKKLQEEIKNQKNGTENAQD